MSNFASAKVAPNNRPIHGPFDISEVADPGRYASFGALHLIPSPEYDIRLEVEDGTERVVAISIEVAQSSLQLQAFAAPKSEGLWNEIRTSLAASIQGQGGAVQEQIGSFGLELLAKLPILDENGVQVGNRTARFLGVDGPRWFLRGMIGGAAIHDPGSASQIEAIFRSVAVERGSAPIPPRDLLTLKVPDGVVKPPRGAFA